MGEALLAPGHVPACADGRPRHVADGRDLTLLGEVGPKELGLCKRALNAIAKITPVEPVCAIHARCRSSRPPSQTLTEYRPIITFKLSPTSGTVHAGFRIQLC